VRCGCDRQEIVADETAMCSEQVFWVPKNGTATGQEDGKQLVSQPDYMALPRYPCCRSWWHRLPLLATVTARGGMGSEGSGRSRRMSCGSRNELPGGKRHMLRMDAFGRTSWRERGRGTDAVANKRFGVEVCPGGADLT
jgi:hypothetical protein